MSSDKRALILRYLDEQIALCKQATKGSWSFNPDAAGVETDPALVTDRPRFRGDTPPYVVWCGGPFWSNADGEFVAEARTGYPLVLAALREEAEAHWQDGKECGYCSRWRIPEPWPCPTISRIFTSLGLQEDGE